MALKIKIDSREQLPLTFKDGVFAESEVVGVPVGDYWCEMDGVELPLCFERKSLSDLYGTMTRGHKRFKHMLERAKEAELKVVLLIEESMSVVHEGYSYKVGGKTVKSKFSGDAMLAKLATMYVKYDLEYHFFSNRREMARYIEDQFQAVERNFKKANKEVKNKK